MSHKSLLDTGGVGRQTRPSIYMGGRGSFLKAVSQKKIPLPSAVAPECGIFDKYLGFLPGTLWEFLQHMAKPQIFGHIPPDIDTALRKERRPPKPSLSSTLLMGKDQFAKGGSSRNARTY